MPWRVWRWTALSLLGVGIAISIDALVFPTPRSSRATKSIADQNISVAPALDPSASFPERIAVVESSRRTNLALTGSYTRRRKMLLTVDIYEVSSFVERLPNGSTEEMLDAIWRQDGLKAYIIRFLFSVPGWTLRQAVRDEMARSFYDVTIDEHREELDRLLAAFGTGASAGDVFYLVRLPENRIYLGVRSEKNLSLVTSSPELSRAIWRMWAGPTAEPGRAGLVKALQGYKEN